MASRGGETGIGMGRRLAQGRGPGAALPVGQALGRGIGQAFPPDITIRRRRDIGEDGVGVKGLDGIAIGVLAGPGGHAKEARLWIDGIEPSVVAKAHPANIIADGLSLPTGDGRLQHGQIGLAAGAGEGCRDIMDRALR